VWWRDDSNRITRNTLDCNQSNYSSCIVFSHIPIEFGQTGISAIRSADPEKPHPRPKTEWIKRSVAEILPFEFGQTGNGAIWSADPKNPTIEPNMKWIGWPLAEIWPFEIFPNERSVGRSVGQSVVNIYFFLHWSHIRLFSTLGT